MADTGRTPYIVAALTLVLAGMTGACAYVGQERFDTEIESLRRQIEEDDRTERQRIDDLSRHSNERMEELSERLNGLSRSLSELRSEFDVTVERLESAVRFHVPVYFEFDEAALRPQDLPVLDRFSAVVTESYPEALLTVEGFTDPAGSVEYNRALGLRRAEAVRNYLVESGGLSDSRVRTVSYGEDPVRLVTPGQAGAEKGWENRRVAVVIEHLGVVGDPSAATEPRR